MSPEVQAIGVAVCSIYVGSGISQELGSLSRTIKLLSGRLDKIKGNNNNVLMNDYLIILWPASGVSIDFDEAKKEESSNNEISVMLHLAVLVAWAELLIASKKQTFLEKVVEPYVDSLLET